VGGTFPDPKFSVLWVKTDFGDRITTYGDVFLSAKARDRKTLDAPKPTLLDALKLSYMPRPSPITRRSMQHITDNYAGSWALFLSIRHLAFPIELA
jgi:hypothetical protein